MAITNAFVQTRGADQAWESLNGLMPVEFPLETRWKWRGEKRRAQSQCFEDPMGFLINFQRENDKFSKWWYGYKHSWKAGLLCGVQPQRQTTHCLYLIEILQVVRTSWLRFLGPAAFSRRNRRPWRMQPCGVVPALMGRSTRSMGRKWSSWVGTMWWRHSRIILPWKWYVPMLRLCSPELKPWPIHPHQRRMEQHDLWFPVCACRLLWKRHCPLGEPRWIRSLPHSWKD